MAGDVAMSHSLAARRLAVATSRELDAIQPDDAHLCASLERAGLELTVCVWNDPQVDWSRFDAVLIRTVWDYFRHHDAFLGWLDQLDRIGVPTINASSVLRWNSDKRYLIELAEHGVAVIPTQCCSAAGLPAALAAMAGQAVVIKPAVSGGAWHTVQGVAGDAAFAEKVAALPRTLDYLLQPFVPEIIDGEWSLLYFAGTFSHAVIKRPAAGDYRVQSEYGGSICAAIPDALMLAATEHMLSTLAALGHGHHAYVRVDGVMTAGGFRVMELELIEPFLFLAEHPAAAERLARDIATRMPLASMMPADAS
jgi:glutathione synthase/RimK-type ligase-like ATP-grasp enzyme